MLGLYLKICRSQKISVITFPFGCNRHYRGSSLFNDFALLLIINPMRIISLLLLFFPLVIESSAQCSMCRAVLESGGKRDGQRDQ